MPTANSSEPDPLTKRLLNIEITLNDVESSIKIHYRRLRDNLLEIIHGLEAEFPIKNKEDQKKRAMGILYSEVDAARTSRAILTWNEWTCDSRLAWIHRAVCGT